MKPPDPAQNQLRSIRFRGGLRTEGLNLTWPLATILIEKNSMVLTTPGKRHFIKKDQVRSLEVNRGLFSQGVKILHDHPELDSPAVFWSFTPRAILDVARRFGFPTDVS